MTPPDESNWDAWSPHELVDRMRPVEAVWYVVGGWALDLWFGEQRREHDDLEFAVRPQDAQTIAKNLSELEFFEARTGTLSPAHLQQPLADDVWQLWGADMSKRCWRVDMMIERGTDDVWVYKRHPSLTLLRKDALRTSAEGILYLAPSLVLLFKAKHCRPKDNDDFNEIAPMLNDHDRSDLRSWLDKLHPSHKWLSQLDAF